MPCSPGGLRCGARQQAKLRHLVKAIRHAPVLDDPAVLKAAHINHGNRK
jgi:hypothetical protein